MIYMILTQKNRSVEQIIKEHEEENLKVSVLRQKLQNHECGRIIMYRRGEKRIIFTAGVLTFLLVSTTFLNYLFLANNISFKLVTPVIYTIISVMVV